MTLTATKLSCHSCRVQCFSPVTKIVHSGCCHGNEETRSSAIPLNWHLLPPLFSPAHIPATPDPPPDTLQLYPCILSMLRLRLGPPPKLENPKKWRGAAPLRTPDKGGALPPLRNPPVLTFCGGRRREKRSLFYGTFTVCKCKN